MNSSVWRMRPTTSAGPAPGTALPAPSCVTDGPLSHTEAPLLCPRPGRESLAGSHVAFGARPGTQGRALPAGLSRQGSSCSVAPPGDPCPPPALPQPVPPPPLPLSASPRHHVWRGRTGRGPAAAQPGQPPRPALPGALRDTHSPALPLPLRLHSRLRPLPSARPGAPLRGIGGGAERGVGRRLPALPPMRTGQRGGAGGEPGLLPIAAGRSRPGWQRQGSCLAGARPGRPAELGAARAGHPAAAAKAGGAPGTPGRAAPEAGASPAGGRNKHA